MGRGVRVHLRQRALRQACVLGIRQGKARKRTCRGTEHQAVARDGAARGEHPFEGVLEDHGPGDHHRRAHSLRRDELVSLQSARLGGVHALAPRPRVRGALQARRCRGEAPRGGGEPCRGRSRARRCVRRAQRGGCGRRCFPRGVRQHDLREEAWRRKRPRTGGELPARDRRACEYC